jgi:hypothetical protein
MRTLAPLAAALLVLSPAAAHAQAAQGPQVRGTDLPKLGLGIWLSPDGGGWAFSVPMLFPRAGTATAFRLEPYFDLNRRTTGEGPAEVTDNSLQLGATGTYVFNVFPYAFGHVGGGLSITMRSYEAGTAEDDSGTATSFYATAGGECFLHPRMSLGVSGLLGVRSSPELRSGSNGYNESSETFASGFITARFYFR